MTEEKIKSLNNRFPLLLIGTSILGYFLYGHSIDAALGIFLLYIIIGLTTLLGVIPIIGFGLTYVANTQYLFPGLYSFTGLYDTWLTSAFWWISQITSIILTAMTTLWLFNQRK